MDFDTEEYGSFGIAEEERFELPPDYRVVLLNDDYTTKEFVVYILMHVFQKTANDASRIMESVHKSGKGVAGVYTYDLAETRAQLTMSLARKEGYPLRCELEKA